MNTPIISYFQDIGFNICQNIFPSKIKSPISPIQFQITFTKQKSTNICSNGLGSIDRSNFMKNLLFLLYVNYN